MKKITNVIKETNPKADVLEHMSTFSMIIVSIIGVFTVNGYMLSHAIDQILSIK